MQRRSGLLLLGIPGRCSGCLLSRVCATIPGRASLPYLILIFPPHFSTLPHPFHLHCTDPAPCLRRAAGLALKERDLEGFSLSKPFKAGISADFCRSRLLNPAFCGRSRSFPQPKPGYCAREYRDRQESTTYSGLQLTGTKDSGTVSSAAKKTTVRMDPPRRVPESRKAIILHVFRPGPFTWLLHASRKLPG